MFDNKLDFKQTFERRLEENPISSARSRSVWKKNTVGPFRIVTSRSALTF